MTELCDECGLPLVECNAASQARADVEAHLRGHGYSGFKAKEAAQRLVPDTRQRRTFGDKPGVYLGCEYLGQPDPTDLGEYYKNGCVVRGICINHDGPARWLTDDEYRELFAKRI